MEHLLLFREKFIRIATANRNWMEPVIRFIGGLLVFYVINQMFGYSPVLSQNFMIVLLAGICVFVPETVIFFLFHLVIIVHLASVSFEGAVIYLLVLVLYYLLYQRMFPDMILLTVAAVVCFYFQIPILLPLIAGAFFGLSALPAILMGTLIYYFASAIQAALLQVENGSASSRIYNYALQVTMGNKDFFLYLFTFIFVTALIAGIRKMQIQFGWYLSIGAGGIVYLFIMLFGGFLTGVNMSIGRELIMDTVGIVLIIALQFFYSVIDYSREEVLEFEDDEYFYYVRAFPKVSVEEEEINIKKISGPPRRFAFMRGSRGEDSKEPPDDHEGGER